MAQAQQRRARAWVFTLNNPQTRAYWPDLEVTHLLGRRKDLSKLPAHKDVKYAVWQEERGGNAHAALSHVQGYVEFDRPMRFTDVSRWLPGAHWEVRKGSREEARDYCMKEDTRIDGPWEHGEFGQRMGERSDLTACRDAIKAGMSRAEVLEAFPEVIARYPRFVDLCLSQYRQHVKLMELVPRPWQQIVLDMVAQEPHDRQVLWIYDPAGGQGKSHLAKHLVDAHGAFYSNGGKATDIMHAYNGERIVIFDYVRDSQEYVGYGPIEQLKNGICFSPKYESGMKRYDVPHVMIFANFMPDQTKMSADRWVIVELERDDWRVLVGQVPEDMDRAEDMDF